MLVMRLAPRQRIAPISSVFMFFHVGLVNSAANAAKADIISGVISGKSLCLIVFLKLKIPALLALATHFMARELDGWLMQGVQSMVDGSYTARHLKRHYFPEYFTQTTEAHVSICDEPQLLPSARPEWCEARHTAYPASASGSKPKIHHPCGY